MSESSGGQKELTPEQRQELKDFWGWVLERSGRSQSRLASDAGVESSALSNYKRGVNGPNFFNTVRLLRAAGVLDPEAPGGRSATDLRLESLEGQVSDLAQNVATFATDVLDRLDQIQAVGTPRRPQRRKAN